MSGDMVESQEEKDRQLQDKVCRAVDIQLIEHFKKMSEWEKNLSHNLNGVLTDSLNKTLDVHRVKFSTWFIQTVIQAMVLSVFIGISLHYAKII